MYQCLVVTGKPGSGKSRLLERVQAFFGARVQYVDPLGKYGDPLKKCIAPPANAQDFWEQPAAADVDAVVFDHVFNLANAVDEVRTGEQWSKDHGKKLFLAEQRLEDFLEKGITLPKDFIHIDMNEVQKCDHPRDALFVKLADAFDTSDLKLLLKSYPENCQIEAARSSPTAKASTTNNDLLTLTKTASKLGCTKITFRDRAVELGFLELKDGKPIATSKGEQAGIQYVESGQYGPYLLFPRHFNPF